MEQKDVKIIGLKINEQMGILKSCELKFDPENNLIAFKGGVGAGKTTIHKALQLGTLGSDALKDDKSLYGKISEEVQLKDGDTSVFIGCKTSKEGGLTYTIYTKDENGKPNKDAIIDGVKATPASYLKELQTALTWRMEELTSENPTIQKRILLELYKTDLASLGVVFDKKDTAYDESILGQIDRAENTRTEMDFKRKQVGGFAKQLDPLGIYPIAQPETVPARQDISQLEETKSKLQHDIENVGNAKKMLLEGIKNKADAIVNKMHNANATLTAANEQIASRFDVDNHNYSQNIHTKNGLDTDLQTLLTAGCFTEADFKIIKSSISDCFTNKSPIAPEEHQLLEFDENGLYVHKNWKGSNEVADLINALQEYQKEYREINNKPPGDTSDFEKQMEKVVGDLAIAKGINKTCDMVDAFLNWHEAHEKVMELKDKYAGLLASVDTGVDGLTICVDKDESGIDIYLTNDGSYDTTYFNNKNKEVRKLSSYSGTQKPMICLLLQSYLLSKKPKAMRYLWIDNVPIDNKTKILLAKMGEELGLTIIVNITGDFDRENLDKGDVFVEGGEVFFN